jgi:Ankyrin repeat
MTQLKLFFACRHNLYERIPYFLADLDARTELDETPMHVAISAGSFEVVRELIKHGATSVDALWALMGSRTPSTKIARLLIDTYPDFFDGASPDGPYNCPVAIFDLFAECGAPESVMSRIIREAVRGGDVAVVDRALRLGFEVTVDGMQRHYIDYKVLFLLCVHGALVDILDSETSEESYYMNPTIICLHACVAPLSDFWIDFWVRMLSCGDLVATVDDFWACVEAERRKVAAARWHRVLRKKALEICVGLAPLDLSALETVGVLQEAFADEEQPFHVWWDLAVSVKNRALYVHQKRSASFGSSCAKLVSITVSSPNEPSGDVHADQSSNSAPRSRICVGCTVSESMYSATDQYTRC